VFVRFFGYNHSNIVIKFFYNYGNKRNNNQNNTLILKNYYYRKGYRNINFDCNFTDQPAEPEAGFHPEFCRDRNLF